MIVSKLLWITWWWCFLYSSIPFIDLIQTYLAHGETFNVRMPKFDAWVTNQISCWNIHVFEIYTAWNHRCGSCVIQVTPPTLAYHYVQHEIYFVNIDVTKRPYDYFFIIAFNYQCDHIKGLGKFAYNFPRELFSFNSSIQNCLQVAVPNLLKCFKRTVNY